jgi:hypothetical protein
MFEQRARTSPHMEEKSIRQPAGLSSTADHTARSVANRFVDEPPPELVRAVELIAAQIRDRLKPRSKPTADGISANLAGIEEHARDLRRLVILHQWRLRQHHAMRIQFGVSGAIELSRMLRRLGQSIPGQRGRLKLSATRPAPSARQLCAVAVVVLTEMIREVRPNRNDPVVWDLCEVFWLASGGSPARRRGDDLNRWRRHLGWALWQGWVPRTVRPDEEDPDTHAVRLLLAQLTITDAVRAARFVAPS